jgi:lipopolysaccharide/colanic/teichoic acid biosynthesis glycosyltransferase
MNTTVVYRKFLGTDCTVDRQVMPVRYLRARRFVEIALIVVVSPLAMFVIFVAALFIKAESGGSAFFTQVRPGIKGRRFKMFKLRTMYVNVSQDQLTFQNDARVTKVGRWLRRFKVDELPQLLNVLKGDMSIIGPRPVPYNFYTLYQHNIPDYDMRHIIRPGITGLAQVLQGYTNTLKGEQAKFEYDKYYLQNISLRMDFFIILKTIKSIRKHSAT